MQPHVVEAGRAGLENVHAARLQPPLDVLEDGRAEKRVRGGAFQRFGQVRDDRGVRLRVFLEEGQRVADDHPGARILERPGRPLGKIALGELDDLAVDVGDRRAADILTAQNLAQRRALAAAQDEDLRAIVEQASAG